jgi:hypothetical protein
MLLRGEGAFPSNPFFFLQLVESQVKTSEANGIQDWQRRNFLNNEGVKSVGNSCKDYLSLMFYCHRLSTMVRNQIIGSKWFQ